MTSSPDPVARLADAATPPGVGALVGRLVEDGRSLVTAEINLAKAKVSARVGAFRTAALLFAVAGVLAFAGLIALLIGLILSLTPVTGPWIATAIVAGGVFLVALVLALIGKARLSTPEPTA